jgi:hypothetical protein
MRVNKTAIVVFIMGCLIFSARAQCVTVTPSNVVLPTSAGGIFSFDLVVLEPNSTSAYAFQATIGVSGPGTLTLDGANSVKVATLASYWAFGNSGDASIFVSDGNCVFGDYTANGLGELLDGNDIMARYAFKWDGSEGNYTFTLDLNDAKSVVQINSSGAQEVLQFNPGIYQGGNNYFIVNIPEPCTLIIFALGASAVLLKRHSK